MRMKIMVFPAFVALTACGGGGGSSTGGVMYQPKSFVISEKSEFLQLQDGLNVGDTLEYPFSLFNPALEGNVTGQVIAITDNGYVVVNGKLPSRTDVPNGQRSLGASDNFYETLFVSGDKTGWNYTTIVEDAGTFIAVSFEEKSGEIFGIASEYQRDENRPDGARVDSFARRITVDGSTVVGMSSAADGSSFNKVNGTFTFAGLGAIAVGTEVFSGGVEMQTTFGDIASTATISAPTLTNGTATASFSGNVTINNISGNYLTEEAQISTASNSGIAATILGQFNTDSTASSATIYDNSTNGKDVMGSFTVAK